MGKITLKQFVEKYNGKSVDYDGWYGAQCVDLFNYYTRDVVGSPLLGTSKTGGARDLIELENAAARAYYTKLPASTKIESGDVLVYGPPHGRAIVDKKQLFYGHVAIAIDSKSLIQQNGRISQVTTIDPIFKSGLLGILRPRDFLAPQPKKDTSDKNKNKYVHIIAKGDTFWAIEEAKQLPHGTLQKLNPGIDPKKLEIGQSINLPQRRYYEKNDEKTFYIIRQGDTLWDLENAWQLTHGTLQHLNPTLDPLNLQISQRIRRS